MAPRTEATGSVFGPFEGSFPIGIPASPGKFLAIREFHVVHGMCLLSNAPGLADQLVASQEDSACNWEYLTWRGFIGSCWLGPGCPVLRVDTRENPKTPKTALEYQVRKGYVHENRGGFGGGVAWWIRSPRGERYGSRGIITRCAASCRARRATRPIKQTLPPSFPAQFCSGSRLLKR
uniref:Uncharacterized protein n=1 Tax=Fagus sylvatica TaxID=28930 RepID=A0A2N9FLI8_FAGSY